MRHASRVIAITLVLLIHTLALLRPAVLADSEWICYGPGLPDPCRNTLHAVAIVPGTGGAEAWAVGDGGTILHLADGAWTKVASPTTESLRGVAAANANLAVAVGLEGALVEWNGTTWSDCTYASTDYYEGVAFVPGVTNDGWAGGHKYGVGFFRHWNGSDWDLKYKGEHYIYGGQMRDMAALNANDIWAVGDSIGKGLAYHWTGDDWHAVTVPDPQLDGVDMVAANSVWAVGEEGTILHWDGAAWSQRDDVPTDEDLYDVSFFDADNGWAVGDAGTVLKWDGASWANDRPGYMRQDLYGVAMASTTYGWAVGEGGIIMRYDGEDWTVVHGPDIYRLEAIEVRDYGAGPEAWAAGSASILLRWRDGQWTKVPGAAGISSYYDVSAASPNLAWAAGPGGRMCRWDGASWTQTHDLDDSISCLEMLSATDLWGFGWSTIQHWDGVSWTSVDCPVGETFYGSDAQSANDIWAVGDDGAIAHYDGSAWHAVASPEDVWLNDVSMVSANEGYIVGHYATVLRWNGTDLTTVFKDVTLDTLRGVSVVNAAGGTRGWAVGHEGQILKLQGGTWSEAESPTGAWLWDVEHVSPYEAWAVGDSGVLLHWEDPHRPTPTPLPTKDPANNVYLPMIEK